MHTMTERKGKAEGIDVKALLAKDEAFLRAMRIPSDCDRSFRMIVTTGSDWSRPWIPTDRDQGGLGLRAAAG
jgi:hypothetical protein